MLKHVIKYTKESLIMIDGKYLNTLKSVLWNKYDLMFKDTI